MVYLRASLAFLAFTTLLACGGGGDASSNQLYTCGGLVTVSPGLVAGSCVPINASTTTTNTAGKCCQAVSYSYDRFSGTYTTTVLGLNPVGTNGCIASLATHSC